MRFSTAVVLIVALFFSPGCDATKALTEGYAQGKAVGEDLKNEFGEEPFVGFFWQNGSLRSVTVSFPKYPEGKSFSEITVAARKSIKRHFSQEPKQIVLSFAVAS